jgi:uncharacterized membrane protein (DUF485 family)
MGPSLEFAELERALTPSWDGIPVVDVKSRGFLSPLGNFFQRHSAFAVVFAVSLVQVSIGWMAYRLFHMLSPDVQRAFLASADVRWTLAVGVLWIVGLLAIASVFVLRATSSKVNAPIAHLAAVSEAVGDGNRTLHGSE